LGGGPEGATERGGDSGRGRGGARGREGRVAVCPRPNVLDDAIGRALWPQKREGSDHQNEREAHGAKRAAVGPHGGDLKRIGACRRHVTRPPRVGHISEKK